MECVLSDPHTIPLDWSGNVSTIALSPDVSEEANCKRPREDEYNATTSTDSPNGEAKRARMEVVEEAPGDNIMHTEPATTGQTASTANDLVIASEHPTTIGTSTTVLTEPNVSCSVPEEGMTMEQQRRRAAAWKAANEKFLAVCDAPGPFNSNGVIVESFGRIVTDGVGWHTSNNIFPLGFKSRRIFAHESGHGKVVYTFEIFRKECDLSPTFRITTEDHNNESRFCEGSTIGSAWEQMLRLIGEDGTKHAVGTAAERQGMMMMFGSPNSATTPTSVSPTSVCEILEGMPGVDTCKTYNFVTMRQTDKTNAAVLDDQKASIIGASRLRTSKRSYKTAGVAIFSNCFVCPYHHCRVCGAALDGSRAAGLGGMSSKVLAKTNTISSRAGGCGWVLRRRARRARAAASAASMRVCAVFLALTRGDKLCSTGADNNCSFCLESIAEFSSSATNPVSVLALLLSFLMIARVSAFFAICSASAFFLAIVANPFSISSLYLITQKDANAHY